MAASITARYVEGSAPPETWALEELVGVLHLLVNTRVPAVGDYSPEGVTKALGGACGGWGVLGCAVGWGGEVDV
jgi:hypothetical protein